jgi:hypothetical protein
MRVKKGGSMSPHLRYLSYVLRHKWFVFWAGVKIGVSLRQLIVHDWTKLLPSEWGPYVDHFYREPVERSREGYYHNPDDAKRAFNAAWLKHINRNPHHWQHWLLTYDSGDIFVLPMPKRFAREMVADWSGAGRAQGHGDDTLPWYTKNRDRMTLHHETRAFVEQIIGYRGERDVEHDSTR